MININQDLEWTIELEEDFVGKDQEDTDTMGRNKRGIPTLDF